MPKHWMEGFLKQQKRKKDEEEHQRELDELGKQVTGSMFRHLQEQIESDIKRFNEERPERAVAFTRVMATRFRLGRSGFPVIGLEVWTEIPGRIDYMTNAQAAASLRPLKTEGHILAIAKSRDEMCYRLEGEDLPDESAAAERLLAPLLSTL